jgi:hypothetical protein
MLFNLDMDRRLADLYAAVQAGETIATAREGAFGHLPERIIYSFGERRFVLDLPTSRQLADYLSAQGFNELPRQITAAAS